MKQADENHLSIRRIMVALDASPRNVEMIEIAAKLAARMGSELIGLFVEDINLLRMADLPFASEIGLFSNGTRRLDSGRLNWNFVPRQTGCAGPWPILRSMKIWHGIFVWPAAPSWRKSLQQEPRPIS